MTNAHWKYLFLIALTAFGCGSPATEEPVVEEAPPVQREAGVVRMTAEGIQRIGLQIAEAEMTDAPVEVTAAGIVALNGDRTVSVSSFVEGKVVKCCKSVGETVKEGDSLVVLHSHQTHEVLATYRQAKAELESQRAALELAERTRDRAKRLYELKAGPLAKVQEAETAADQAQRALESAEAAVQGARAHFEYLGVENPDEATDHLKVVVASPLTGTIISRSVTPGSVVAETDELYVVSNVTSVWVMAQVPEAHLASLRPGMEAEVKVQGYPDRVFRGRVTRIGAELNPDTRTVQVRCAMPNGDRALKAGMYASVTLKSQETGSALAIPKEAVQSTGDEAFVFTPTSEGTFKLTPVRVGRDLGEAVEIVSGLSVGDRVVAHGSFLLKAEMSKEEAAGE